MAYDRTNGEDHLDVHQIQGDILVGLQKDFEWFVGFSIGDVPKFRLFLKQLAPRVTTTRKVLEREFTIAQQKKLGIKQIFNFAGLNIGFTAAGLSKLGIANLDQIKDASFRAGLAAQSSGLGDPISGEGAPSQWRLGKPNDNLHGLVLITGPTQASVDATLQEVRDLAGTSWTEIYAELGKTRPVQRGHEHFGYLDGVSQPGVRGQIDQAFPTHRFLTESQNPDDPGQGLPGSDLLWPGAFLFGYQSQQPGTLDDPGPISDGGLPWMKNGSFMVFRRLKQLVPEFGGFVDSASGNLDMDPDLLGARMVGRWKSGAPLVIAPMQDEPELGTEVLLRNKFEFSADAGGRRCPYAAHIRKAYPRDDITPAGAAKPTDFEKREASEANTQTHRIIRAGIPFGDEVGDDEEEQGKTLRDRGLMFVCYQAAIADQFEFITKFWVNNPAFPPASNGTAGQDPILGQGEGASRSRSFGGAVMNYPTGPHGNPITLPADFIVPTGGGYFFVPSISAIRDVLAAS
jgi:Dyp-type peroxidase family